MSTRHPAVDKWGMKKYGVDYDLPEGTEFEIEEEIEYGGFCDTCRYESEYIDVRVRRPGETSFVTLTSEYTDLAEIMREILDATS